MTRMATQTRVMWRAMRDAGPSGLTKPQLWNVVPGLTPQSVHDRLRSLLAMGYAVREGTYAHATFRIGPCVPDGESAQRGAPSQAVVDLPPEPVRMPRGSFNSVWQLASTYAEQA